MDAREKQRLKCTVNGQQVDVLFDGYKTLLEVLREELALNGTKHGCELGECGACAVLLDGKPVLSCLTLALECGDRRIETIEGVGEAQLHPLQAAFADLGGSQCGYCTPAMILTAKELLQRNPDPGRDEIRESLAGVLCRCTGYQQIFESVEQAAEELRRGETADELPRGETSEVKA